MASTTRRFRLVVLCLVVVVGGALLLWRQPSADNNTATTPPAQVIIKQAVIINQGVQVEWLEGQAGTYPITGYVVERSREGSNFMRIARVEKLSLKHLDTEGQAGDKYRIIAEDNQKITARSLPSEHVVATLARPGSTVLVASSAPSHALGITTTQQADTPTGKAATLQDLIIHSFTQFDTALAGRDFSAAAGYLNTLQDYQRQILFLLPQLSSDTKSSLAQMCTEQMGVFEANLHVLPEHYQLDGMLVLAGCNAIKEDTR